MPFWEFVENLICWVFLGYFESQGKFSLASPLVTGWIPTIIGSTWVIVHVVANIWLMDWWAEGNLYLVFIESLTIA